MKLTVNGEEKTVPDGMHVAALLESLGVEPELVAVEVNLDIIPRAARPALVLREGDVVEVVKFVGGGRG